MAEITPEILITSLLIQALISAFFCQTLYKALLTVRESNRTIKAGKIWLLMIPGVEKIWNFGVVSFMASSLHKEFDDRNFEIEKRPGFNYGMIYATLSVVYTVLLFLMLPSLKLGIPSLDVAAGVLNILGIIFFILYWQKISWYRRVLENDNQESDNPDQ